MKVEIREIGVASLSRASQSRSTYRVYIPAKVARALGLEPSLVKLYVLRIDGKEFIGFSKD